MEWTEESIARLRALWAEGHSTAEIGRRLGVSKNAVVGKAHRLNLAARPSPIRRSPAGTPVRPTSPRRVLGPTLPPLPGPVASPGPVEAVKPALGSPAPVVRMAAAVTQAPTSRVPTSHVPTSPARAPVVRAEARVHPRTVPATPTSPPATSPPAPATVVQAAAHFQEQRAAKPAPVLRPVPPARANRFSACCWPIGEPGKPSFHFCGGEALVGKPYCPEHAQLAYVKIRDRREEVA